MLLVCDSQGKYLAKLLDARVSDNFWVFGHILPGAQLISVIAAIKSKAKIKAGGNLFISIFKLTLSSKKDLSMLSLRLKIVTSRGGGSPM